MNKIYKVIWSKVRNCYVAVSEIAKRNGKSCTSVNCGGSANRGHAGVALAIALSLSMTGGGVAWAEDVPDNRYFTNPINTATNENYVITEDGVKFTVNSGGSVLTITSSKSGNSIVVNNGGQVTSSVKYPLHYASIRGGISNNTITINGVVASEVLGGYSQDSVVTNNKVKIDGGTSRDVYGGSGYSYNSPVYGVNKNTVTISSGTVSGDVYGGYHNSSSDVLGNKVEISDGTTVSGYVYGGSSAGNAGGPDTIVGGQTVKNGNTVSITDGTVSKAVYGGNVGSGSGNNAVNNSVTISGSSTIGTPETVIYNKNIYGGYTIGTGNATGNTVNINLSSDGRIWGTVYGGYSAQASANSNTVKISGTVSGGVYGGYSNSSSTSSSANENDVTIQGTVTSDVNGGNAYKGNVSGNIVYIKSGASVQKVAGGSAREYGSAETNTVEISGGTVSNIVMGGFSERGIAGGDTKVKGNTVTISAGSVTNHVYGGFSPNYETNNKAIYNTVEIKGGTIGGASKSIYGGYAGKTAQYNIVTITGGTIKSTSIEGGHSTSGDATYNTVTIAGGNFNSASSNIYGGYVQNSGHFITNNTINLYGTVTGLNNAGLYGSNYSNTYTTGNELYIGGVKDNTMLATGTQASPWTGTTGNKVTSVNNFNSIVLHKVDWSTTTPVLAAVSFNNNFASDGYLDISGMTFTGTPNYGTLALLKSDAPNNFTTLRLKYNNGAAIQLNSNKPKQIKQAGTSTSESSSTNGVKFAYNQKEHVVSLDVANSYKNVLYSVVDNVTGITFDSMTWGTGRDLSQATHHYDFSNATTINASNLTFAKLEEGALSWFSGPSIKTRTEMTLIANATGITAGNSITQPTTGKGTVSIQLPCAGMVVDATAKGTVSAGTDVVKYVVDEVKVGKLTLGETDWADSYGLSFKNWGWTLASDAVIDATNMTYKKTYSIKKVGDKHSVVGLNISGTASINNIIMPSSGKVAVPNTVNSDSAITFDATAYGDVIFEDNTVKTKITSVELDKVTLGTYSWGTSKNMPDSSWTASASTKIDDTNFAYTGNANTKLKQNDTAVILNATGLATNSEVIRDSGASATKTVGMNFTDSSGDGASSIRFTGTAKGHVEAAADKVNYVVDGATLDSIDLASWNGTTFNLDSTTWGWELAKDTPGAVTATVATAGMTVPSGLSAGEKKVIIEATGTDYFDGINIGEGNKWSAGTTLTDTAVLTSGGVTIAGTQTKAGVKVNEANKKQLVYEASKKNATSITLGKDSADESSPVTYVKNGTARSFDNTFDVSNADIYADNLTFTDASKALMETNDTMTIVDASGAIANSITGQKLQTFVGKTYVPIAFTDTITGKNLTFAGTHTDTLTQSDDAAKSKLIYTVGAKNVTTATLSGDITWGDNSVYYKNGEVENQNGVKPNYVFGSSSAINIGGVQFSATTDPMNKSMTLLKGVTGVVATKVSGTPSFTVALTQNNTKLDAKATGSASVSGNDVIYSVNGVAIDKINVTSIENDADTVPTGWTLAKDNSNNVIATVETDGLSVSDPSGLEPGETKVLIKAADGATNYFNGVAVNGSHAWKVNGSTITSDLDIGGVAITGTQTKGGVKVNEANTNQIIYEESKKKINTLTLGSVTFANDDGTAATVARTFDKTYDVSTATINADDLAFANSDIMEKGNSMRIVDASAAIPNAISNKKLPAFTEQTEKVAFTDTITGKNLTLKGAHTDTLSQDAAQTTLTYTVGDKKVSSATLAGDIAWNDGGTHYTNGSDANQNGTKATYTFDGNSAVDISSVSFNAAADPLAGATKTMTLLKDVNGVASNKVSGTPAFVVTLDQTNTKLDAKATGSAGVSGSDVTYTVSGVAINKVNIKSVGSTADMVPANWTLAKDSSDKVIAKVETDNMTKPSNLSPGETKVIITATGTDYFSGVEVKGGYAWTSGGALTSDLEAGGVMVAGNQTKGGVKVNEANKNQLIYEETKKKLTSITLGEVTFAKDGTARAFDKTYDATSATINANNLKFAEASRAKMETGNTMTMVDATAALKNANDETLAQFNGGADKTYSIAFNDTVTGKNLTLAGTHTDTLSQADDTATSTKKSKLVYTVGDKLVSSATLTGDIAWNDGGTHYTNGSDANQNGTKATYKFDGNSAVDISGVAFSATSDPLAGTTKSMTLLKGVSGVVATKVSGTPSFTVALTQNNTKLDASASGSAGVSGSDVTYTVSGVAINKVNIKSVGSTADTVPANWMLASGATVETDDLVVASPSGLEPGETKVLIKAADGATNYFNGVSVNGNYAWKVDNSTITSELDIGGVAITGTQTKGGVKVNEANTNQIIYEESKKKINTLTLGSVTFANDDGTAATVARTFDKTYDVSTATISADGLAFANSDTMETGNLMRIVDASAAIPNAISNNKLSAFAGQTYEVAFSDTITGKNLTLAGTHTDTLSQDAAQSTLTYTVGDKKVSSATLTGDIAWNDGGTHYTNGSDANQNGTKATYKFDGNSAVDISGVQFNATVDPLGKSMTLLKDVNGVVATKVSGTPSFTVALDQTNTKLDANATGDSGVSGNDVTFTVSGVTLDKITVKSANGTADKVPASWTMAAGATIETDSMNVPELAAGTHVDILQSDTDGFFANVPINGANAYGNTQETFTESDAAKSVSIAGTQDKGVTLNTEKKHLIYKAGTLDVASVTLGPAEWKKGATVFDRSGAGYNYADVAALGTDSFAVSYASPETIAAGDSMTLLQANATLKDMAERVKKTSYSYTPVTGVTVDANITGKLAISGGVVTFTAAENQAGKLTFGSVDWKDSSALMTRPKNITFSGADVDTAKINFTNITLLDANKQMTLVSDFGDKVGTITGTKYMVGTTSEGEGVASLSGSDLIFTTKTGAGGAAEQTHRTVMATEAGIAALAAGQEYVDSAVEGLGMLTNLSPDGTSTFAAMGGGASRYKTGSHVDTRTWNAVVAVGSKREHKKGTFEWGVFAEYGKGNYTLHSDDGGRGDGDTHYAGGGLLAKWTNKHKVYTEASVRMGRISDSASNMLRDGEGNQYGYNVHANYYGGHIGIGKLFEVKKNRELDVYGKFFYTRRNGVSFNAAGRYDLDAVNSSLLRVGARYGSTDKKWNWYGGLAYEYQFDGESGGMLNGNTPIRAASIKGGSVRGEIGLRMDATETNPWKVDFSIYGYGGKHRGIGGSVNVAYMF